jgi:hypothetical protein
MSGRYAVAAFVLVSLMSSLFFASNCHAQDRISIADMGWSFEPATGWTQIDRRTLSEIEDDLRYALGSAQVRAGLALRDQGALPRLLVNVYPMELGSVSAARALIESLSEPSGDESDTSLEFSSRSSMAHAAGEVFILSHGWAGANGLVQVVVYTRQDDLAAAQEALDLAVRTAAFEAEAQITAQSSPLDQAQEGSRTSSNRMVSWGVRGAIIGAMVAVIVFGIRFLRAMWAPTPPESEE